MAKATKLARPAEDDGRLVDSHHIRYGGRKCRFPAGKVNTGLFLKRFLWRAAQELKLSGPEKLTQLGVVANNLATFGDCKGTSLRRGTLLAICIRTQMWARELAQPGDEWAQELDRELAAIGFAPLPKRSLRQKLGKAWHAVRKQAQRDVDQTTPATLPAGDVPLAGEIHQLVVSNQLPRGAEIDLLKLARRLDEKLSVIETALRHLARRRVVSISTSQTGARYRVAAVSRQEAREIMLVRSLVEHCLVLELGKIRRRGAIIAAMKSALSDMRQALEEDDSQSFINHDIEFHVALAEGRTYIGGLLTNLTDVIHTAVPSLRNRAAFQQRIVGEHEAILKLITQGDYAGAAEAVRRHILNAGEKMF